MLCPQFPASEVLLLFPRKFIYLHTERLQLKFGYPLVNIIRDLIYLLTQLFVILGYVLARKRLIGEAHVHDARGVALGRGEVYEPPLSQKVYTLSVFQGMLVHKISHLSDLLR